VLILTFLFNPLLKMEKRWVLKSPGDTSVINRLSVELAVDRHIAKLLVQRGITTYEGAKAFFRPELSNLHDPFLMKDMDKAVERIESAIKKGEKILVYGDYDVDGTTAVALVYTFLKKLNVDVGFYIPDRYLEGYGISYKGIDYAENNGFSLIIALDCGIKAVEEVKYATDKEIDFIICDHHRPGNELPIAAAILDPKRPDCSYPYDDLSGCGVGFKLIQAYSQLHNLPFNDLEQYLDLVVVSIASDIVNITGENRILSYYGLKLINTNPRPGIEAILRYSNIYRNENLSGNNGSSGCIFNRELSITDLVFLVGPRINASGRIESANSSVELLISDNIDSSMTIGQCIDNTNTERKTLDTQITAQALEMIDCNPELKNSKSTVLFNPDWHKGVVGIVASRVTETYYRPTIILTLSNNLICGSARSVKDFDVYDAIDACSEYLEHFGGHKYAAGLSLKPENLEVFKERFEKVVADVIEDHMLTPEIEIDDELSIHEISPKFFRILKQFAPFGPGNMSPVFRSNKVVDNGFVRVVGKNHLKMNLVHPHISGLPVPAIAFQQGDFFDEIKNGKGMNICYHLELNEWNGNISLQLNIKDIKICDDENDDY